MSDGARPLLTRLTHAAEAYDRGAIDGACAALIAWASRARAAEPHAEAVVTAIRDQRCWHALGAVAGALLARGNDTEMVRSCMVQSAIDSGELGLARGLIGQLMERYPEDLELHGLEGRLHKQRFVRAAVEGAPPDVRRALLEASLSSYLRAYESRKAAWHGINAVALAKRAERDGMQLAVRFDADAEAATLLRAARADVALGRHDPWSYALILEAAIALGLPNAALAGALGFVSDHRVGPFALAGTLRQLREIWAVDETSVTIRSITSLLEATIVARHGGASVVLRSDAPSPPTRNTLRELVEDSLARVGSDLKGALEPPRGLERVFEGTLVAYDSLLAGIACCDSIARLEHATSHNGKGTGFLLAGELLDPRLGPQPLLITNAHVLDRDTSTAALDRASAAVCFERGPNREHTFGVDELVWVSPVHELDICVARLREPPACALRTVAQHLPPLDRRSFVYVVGHAGGSSLSFSLMDNLLLDYDERVLHYRCATQPGNSGSPVFNLDWELIGVHHAGRDAMPRLHQKPGTYAANEGICVHAIRAALQRS